MRPAACFRRAAGSKLARDAGRFSAEIRTASTGSLLRKNAARNECNARLQPWSFIAARAGPRRFVALSDGRLPDDQLDGEGLRLDDHPPGLGLFAQHRRE